MMRRLRLLLIDAELAWIALRLAWVRVKIAVGCFLMGTTPAEVRRQIRLEELAGRWPRG